MCFVQCTVYSVQCEVLSVQCVVCRFSLQLVDLTSLDGLLMHGVWLGGYQPPVNADSEILQQPVVLGQLRLEGGEGNALKHNQSGAVEV